MAKTGSAILIFFIDLEGKEIVPGGQSSAMHGWQ